MESRDGLAGGIAKLGKLFGTQIALSDGESGNSISFEELAETIPVASAELDRLGLPRGGLIAFRSALPFQTAQLFLSLAPHRPLAPIPAHAKLAEVRDLLGLLRPAALVLAQHEDGLVELCGDLEIPCLLAQANGTDPVSLAPLTDGMRPAPNARRLDGPGVVLTTSGTTGTPKLVALDETRLILSAGNIARSLDLRQSDTGIVIMPLHHVHGLVTGLLAPLLVGARSLIQPSPDPRAFLETAAATGASWYTAVPTMHRAILDLARRQPELAERCTIRLARSASSALPSEVRQGIASVFNCAVVEAYGMTEATHMICTQMPGENTKHGDVGRPEAVSLEVRDGDRRAVGDAEPGEIWIRGDAVIDGYLDNPAANASTFDNGWMRTGDIGRLNPDGTLTIIAREKEVVKRGGAQVAPTEIEEALLARPGVRDAIAFGVAHPTLGQDLAAAVVIDPASGGDVRELRASLFDVLSDYKVPSRILTVAEIPKGPTGKPRRLDMEHLLAGPLNAASEPPRSATEGILSALFAATLGRDTMGRSDDFFLSGGDSLSGTSTIVELNMLLRINLSPEILFRYPTVAELGAHVDAMDGGRVKHSLEALYGDSDADTAIGL
ncbi:non-ribosomal peptide synthetase [Salipiger sp. H15]|uniref:Non-ribosomal peptide synthetase n=1 Tax=Alloyangia sp. H15 TaxID=3029062 RepID=A0AAU8APF4_9RHOB